MRINNIYFSLNYYFIQKYILGFDVNKSMFWIWKRKMKIIGFNNILFFIIFTRLGNYTIISVFI